MEIRGDNCYLTPLEQRESGYDSPIDMLQFDLHEERMSADAMLDQVAEMRAADDITEGAIIALQKRAQARSNIARSIGKELATRTLVANSLEEITDWLQGS